MIAEIFLQVNINSLSITNLINLFSNDFQIKKGENKEYVELFLS